ncbi:hypothetical protein CG709_10610, partial [Lachnotalea glycerini]
MAKILIIVLVVLIAILVVLYFLGKRLEKKQTAQQQQIEAAKQNVTMLIRAVAETQHRAHETGRNPEGRPPPE